MSKFTPGPWMICSPNLDAELNCGTLYIRTAEEAQEVAVVHHRLHESATPNAELISAAPELLAALKGALEVLSKNSTANFEVLKKGIAAIAKAEGGE